MDELVATTTRTITFSCNGSVTKRPAGTEVYVTEQRDGWCRIHIAGTRWTQLVRADSLMVP